MTTKSQYAMTEEQIEALAAERTQSVNVTQAFDGTYLKVLITGVQAKLGQKRGRRPAIDSQLSVLEAVATPFYAAVLRGVITADIELGPELEPSEAARRTRERNRRATFARTAKSTLVAWVNEGGDLRALDVTTVTKTELRAEVVTARGAQGITPVERIEKAQAAILTAVAREGPAEARRHLQGVITALQEALSELPPNGETHHESAAIRTRVGLPTFRTPRQVHRSAVS
jgi:hypothetical protein